MGNLTRQTTVSVFLCTLLIVVRPVYSQSVTINIDVFGLNENQASTNQTLEDSCVSASQSGATNAATADFLRTCDILNPLSVEDPSLSAALDRLLPEEAFAVSDALTDASDLQITNVNARIRYLREQQNAGLSVRQSVLSLTEGEVPSPRLQNIELFLSGQFSSGQFDGGRLQQDADLTSSQITFGADYRVSDQFIVGAGLGVFNHETEFESTAGNSEVVGTNATLFATYAKESVGYLDVVLDIGSNSFELSRQINIEGNNEVLAMSDTDSSSLSFTVGAGKNFRFSGFDVSPYVRVGRTSASVDAYSEEADSEQPGFGSILRVGSQSIKSTTVSIGASVARVISTRRVVLVPQLSLETELEIDGDKDPLTAFFLADPNRQSFRVMGEERDDTYLNLGVGSNAIFAGGKSAYAFYETRLAHESLSQHWFKFGMRLEF